MPTIEFYQKYCNELQDKVTELQKIKDLYDRTQKDMKELAIQNKAYEDTLKQIAWNIEATTPQSMIMKGYAKKALDEYCKG